MKDGPISKLTITNGGQQITKYKKIIDALPVFCKDRGYKFINDVIWTNTELLEAAFLPTYPNATLWSSTYHVQVDVVGATVAADPLTLCCPLITEMQRKSNVFNPNLLKGLLSKYDLKCKLKLQEWSKLTADKKSLMTIICG